MSKYLINIGSKSRFAFQKSLFANENKKNLVLKNFNKLLKAESTIILKKNLKDLKIANQKKLKDNMIDRLVLNGKRIDNIRHSINEIIKLKDPVGKVLSSWKRPNGLLIKKVSIPIGVIGIIFESRPNVACDVSSLCFKSGNTAILRGGSESLNSNSILTDLFRESLKKAGFNKDCIQLITPFPLPSPNRPDKACLLREHALDLLESPQAIGLLHHQIFPPISACVNRRAEL